MRWLGVAEWVVHGLGGEQVAELSLASRPACSTWSGGPGGTRPGPVERRLGLLADLVQAGSPAGRVAGGRLGRLAGPP